jgi:hypothetical protein
MEAGSYCILLPAESDLVGAFQRLHGHPYCKTNDENSGTNRNYVCNDGHTLLPEELVLDETYN